MCGIHGRAEFYSVGHRKRREGVADAPPFCFLRPADALHFATATEYRFSKIYSNDRRLLEAAPLFGLRGVDVIP